MKRASVLYALLFVTASIFSSVVSFGASESEEVWVLPENPPSWARNDDGFAVKSAKDDSFGGKVVARIVHKTPTDWAVRIPKLIDAAPGDIFELTCLVKNEGKTKCDFGVVLYDPQGTALDWNFGGAEIYPSNDLQTSTSKFLVPVGVAKIEPRVIGSGDTDVSIAEYKIQRVGRIVQSDAQGTLPAENAYLRVVFHLENGSFDVRDVRTNRVWRQDVANSSQFVVASKPIERGVKFELLDARSFTKYDASIQLEKDAPEIVVKLSAPDDAPLASNISYPFPFATKTTDRIILPLNEGISFPTTEPEPIVGVIHTYGGHGLCMAFWGVVNDVLDPEKSDGIMGIIETPDDARIDMRPRKVDSADKEGTSQGAQTLSVGGFWEGALNRFGYDRVLRYVFFDKGGYVAQCKRYREYADKIGLLVSFDDKIKRNPKLEDGLNRLIGAANIWCWDGAPLPTIRRLKALGIDRILWSGGGSSEDVDAMNKIEGVLSSRYDIYQDVMDPARYDELPHIHGDWIAEAWPKDLLWDASNGHWARGWEVDPKDKNKPRIPCGVLCDSKSVGYAEKRIGDELKSKDYRCRFLDTTVASPWRECWNPDHPMTRSECRKARMELLNLLGERFNLVCGSETGIDASVPFCDYYEGMMSLGPYRCPDSGRYVDRIWHEVPDLVRKYQVGESYRLPLFELVYHGCVVSYWYWGDHNDKFPEIWRKRDLFNALYGVPPMYCFTTDFLDENADRFEESYQIAAPVAKSTGRVPMTDHRVLTEDRTVQKSSFANGLEVIVNFGKSKYRSEDGTVVPPESSRLVGIRGN